MLMESEQSRLQINWISSAGGALGAVSSAVVLSTFGVAGTLIGAAVGSLCISIGGSLYAHYLRRTKERVELARLAALRARTRAHGRPTAEVIATEQLAADAKTATTEASESVAQAFRGLPWKRILAATAALFVVSMALIVAFELRAGRTLSSFTGDNDSDRRTSIPRIGGGGGDSDQLKPDRQEQESPDNLQQPTPDESSSTPEPDVPSEETPTVPAPTETTPSEPIPTEEPTTEPPPDSTTPTTP